MITVKEYADKWGISTQAVYKQLATHAAELEGHIHNKKGSNARWLDEQAVEILERIRETNPVVIERDTAAETIAALKQEIEDLKAECKARADEAYKLSQELRAQDKAIATADMQLQLLEQKKDNEIELLKKQNVLDIRKAEDDLKNQLQECHNKEIRVLEDIINSFEKSWFGFYRKKK